MALKDVNGKIVGERGLNSTAYEHDYFCLAAETPILIKRQDEILTIFVENILSGDLVLSVNDKGKQEWKEALLTKHKAPKKLISIRAKNEINVTHTHKLFKPNFEIQAAGNLTKEDSLMSVNNVILPSNKTFIKITDFIKDIPDWMIIEKDKIGHYNYKQKKIINNKIKLDRNFGLLIGLYLAEGSLVKNSIQFALHPDEQELTSLIEQTAKTSFGEEVEIKTLLYPKYSRRVSYIHNKTLRFIFNLLFPGHAKEKQIPSFAYEAPVEFKLGLLHGWLFGDGTYKRATIVGSSISKLLISGFHNLSLSIGILSQISHKIRLKETEQDVYNLFFSSREVLEQLKIKDTIWKHSKTIKRYLDPKNTIKSYTKEQVSSLFLKHYKKGMTCNVFCKQANIYSSLINRLYKTWYNLLKEHGYEEYSVKTYYSRKDILIKGLEWIKNNPNYSESKWIKDKKVPSICWIYKYFKKSSIFFKTLLSFSLEDEKRLKQKKENYEKNLSVSKITKFKEINYLDEFVYDLQVKDNSNFLIGNIISHNSATQCSIMIGDVLIDTIVNISAQINQNKVPVYNYANPYYSFLGGGQIAVTGSLTIAFKESGYLLYALKRFADFKNNSVWQSPRYYVSEDGFTVQRPEQEITGETKFKSLAEEGRRKKTMRANVEQMMEWQETIGNESFNPKERNAARLQNNKFVKQLGALNDDEFEDWAETFEDALWYSSDIQNSFMADKINSFNLKDKKNIEDEELLSHRRPDQYPPVDIWLIYGDTNNHATNHTVQKIIKASFLGMSKTIEVNDQPIYETFPFIAQNLV